MDILGGTMNKVKKVTPILQMESTECGAASLAMILKYYGKDITLKQLRYECGVTRNGVNAKSILRVANYHNLKTRALRVPLEEIQDVALPAIIHWNMDHFLVLCGFSKKGVVLADPAYGKRIVSMDEFSKSFTGIVIELAPTDDFKKSKIDKSYKYISSCIKSFLPCAIYFIIIEICMLSAGIVLPFINSLYIDKIIINGSVENLKMLNIILLVTGFILVIGIITNVNIRQKLRKELNEKINFGFIKRIMKLPIEFFSQRSAGELSGRHNANMGMGNAISLILSPLPAYVMQAIVYLIVILLFDVQIAMIGIICALINIVSMLISSKKYEELWQSYNRDLGILRTDTARTVDMIETIKSCGCEDTMLVRLISSGTKAINTKTKINQTSVYSETFAMMFNIVASSIVLIAGIWKILNGDITTGILIAMQAFVAEMLEPITNLVNTEIAMHTLKSDMEYTDDVMSYNVDKKFLDDEETQLFAMDGNIVLSNLDYTYNKFDEPFIKDFNLEIKKGSSVALTGYSNSGKSTIAKIIAGLFCETAGSISFGEATRNKINHYYFYSKVAVVSQNIRLFEGTVLDNIAMWDENIPYDSVVEAAKMACIHDDIINRVGGYRERVIENGKNFSGGQRQRIEIARALVKKPEILVLDEATSALDDETEEAVMNHIKSMGITLIMVAHRLSSIRDCDDIIVLENGSIIERGTHAELMKLEGNYYNLVKS